MPLSAPRLAVRSLFAAGLLMLAGAAAAEDLEFTLNNESSFAITHFYASPSDVGSWEDDILGQDILPSGESINITIGDGRSQCDYDLRFQFEDGDVVERAAVNLCDTGSYTLTD